MSQENNSQPTDTYVYGNSNNVLSTGINGYVKILYDDDSAQ